MFNSLFNLVNSIIYWPILLLIIFISFITTKFAN